MDYFDFRIKCERRMCIHMYAQIYIENIEICKKKAKKNGKQSIDSIPQIQVVCST